jgi:hypothetical protein
VSGESSSGKLAGRLRTGAADRRYGQAQYMQYIWKDCRVLPTGFHGLQGLCFPAIFWLVWRSAFGTGIIPVPMSE